MNNIVDKEKFIKGLGKVSEISFEMSDDLRDLLVLDMSELHKVIQDYVVDKIRLSNVADEDLDNRAGYIIERTCNDEWLEEIGLRLDNPVLPDLDLDEEPKELVIEEKEGVVHTRDYHTNGKTVTMSQEDETIEEPAQ